MARSSVLPKHTVKDYFPQDLIVIDAIGRRVNPATDYVWTVTSVKGTFDGAVSSGWIPNSEIVGLCEMPDRPGLFAAIQDKTTGEIAVWGMNPDTARPYRVQQYGVGGAS